MSTSSSVSASGGKQTTILTDEVVARDVNRGEDFTVIRRQLAEILFHLRTITGETPHQSDLEDC